MTAHREHANHAPARKRFAALQWLGTFVFAVAAAMLLVWQIGYAFEAGDQLQYLLLPYRELLVDFLPDDWFTWHTAHYHLTFAWLVRGLHAITGATGFARGMFVVHALDLAAFGYALLRLSRALRLGVIEAAFCVVTFACVRQVGLAGAVVNHGGLVPADLALAPFLLACAAFIEARTIALGMFLGIAGFLHANYAVLGPLALFPLLLVRCASETDRAQRVRGVMQMFGAGVLFAIIASPSLALVVTSFLTHDSAPAAVALTLFVRSPHHYDLGAMRLDQFYYSALITLAALPYLLGLAGRATQRRAHLQLVTALSVLVALGFIGSGMHVIALARLFTWRMSIPLFALLHLAAGCALREYARDRAWLKLAWLSSTLLLTLCFAQTDQLESSPWNDPALFRVAAWAIGILVLAAPAAFAPIVTWRAGRMMTVAAAALTALALGTSVVQGRYWRGATYVAPRGLHFLDAAINLTTPVRPLYALIRERTPPDARFLVPPGQSLFRLQARRGIFVDWKCAPMKGDEALEWQRRMLLAMGLPEFPARGYELPRAADRAYASRPLAALAELARSEHLSHVLARKDGRPTPPSLHREFESNGYVVYSLTGEPRP